MTSKTVLRKLIRNNLDVIADHINSALRGEYLPNMERVLARICLVVYHLKTLK